MHCLGTFDTLNWDHVFPKAWYPDTTPANLEKWEIPSCRKCNREYGKLEDDLLIRLGLCINPKESKSSGIADKVLRSINPKFGKDERDKRIRKGKRDKIIRESLTVGNSFMNGILPNFGPHDNATLSESMGIPISPEKLTKLGYKLVRGITYIVDKKFIEKDYEIEVHFLHDSSAKQFIEKINKYGQVYHRGPGVTVGRAIPDDDKNSPAFYIEIWGKLKMYATLKSKIAHALRI